MVSSPLCRLMLCALAWIGISHQAAQASTPPKEQAVLVQLARIASGQRPCRALTVSYSSGPGMLGETHVRIDIGQVVARLERHGRKRLEYRGTLDRSTCRKLANLAAKFATVKSKRTIGVPDETQPTIALGVSQLGTISRQIWHREVQQFPAFKDALSLLVDLAKRVSGGRITY